MPLLDRRIEVEHENLAVRIPKMTSERIRQYARFVNRDRAEVVEGLLEYALSKDKEFAEWLLTEEATKPEPRKATRNGNGAE